MLERLPFTTQSPQELSDYIPAGRDEVHMLSKTELAQQRRLTALQLRQLFLDELKASEREELKELEKHSSAVKRKANKDWLRKFDNQIAFAGYSMQDFMPEHRIRPLQDGEDRYLAQIPTENGFQCPKTITISK